MCGVVHVLAYFAVACQAGCVVATYAVSGSYCGYSVGYACGCGGCVSQFRLEECAVDNVRREGCQYFVAAAGPCFQRAPYVVVVKQGVMALRLGVMAESGGVDIVVEEVAQRGRSKEVYAAVGQAFGPQQGVDEHFLARHCGLVEVDLPVHKAARHEVVLDGVKPLGVYHEPVAADVEHFYYAVAADIAFGHAGEEAVAAQVVEAVHVELATYELVEVLLGVFVLEYLEGEVQSAVHFAVDLFHQEQRYLLVAYSAYERALEHVGEWAVPDVVHEYGGLCGLGLAVEDEHSFLRQRSDGFAHEVVGAERMLEAGVLGRWVDH